MVRCASRPLLTYHVVMGKPQPVAAVLVVGPSSSDGSDTLTESPELRDLFDFRRSFVLDYDSSSGSLRLVNNTVS